jgi:precorrin-2 dehydrogenase/sirohydrochlorin ferrochelatase
MKILFPLFLKLEGRRCLVVGAGAVGEGKIDGLLESEAEIRVVAPKATERVRRWASAGRIRWLRRKFRDSDLDGCFCVVAATNSNHLHEKIFRLARQRGVLCNVVDVPELCDFYYPAVVRRGALQIAISTSGESPALAQRLRKKLEKQFGPEYSEWVEQIGSSRRKLNAASQDAEEKKSRLHSMASEHSFRIFQREFRRERRGIRPSKHTKQRSPLE